jgi:hypothetical protein
MATPVPSWQVTADMLNDWGFPVEVRDKCVGMAFVEKAGMPFGKALHAAWAAGFVRIAVTPESVVAERRAAFHARNAREPIIVAETVAALKAAGMFRTSSTE